MEERPQLPDKRPGKTYGVVFRTHDYSGANVALKGALGGRDNVPVPVFQDQCVCCNGPTMGLFKQVTPTDPSDRFEADPIEVPVCAECMDHAVAKTTSEVLVACLLCVGVPLIFLGFFSYDLTWLGGAGIAITLLALFWWWRLRVWRLRHTHTGHHPGFAMMVAPRQLVVRTPNRKLVEALVHDNSGLFDIKVK